MGTFTEKLREIVDNLDSKDEAILEIATVEFAENGFYNANMDNIAQEAEVGKGTLYRRFYSKQHLFFAIMRKGFLDFLESVQSIDEHGTVREQINAYSDIFVRIIRTKTDLVRLFAHEQSKILEGINEDLVPFIHETNQGFMDFWVRLVHHWQREHGNEDERDPEVLGEMLSIMFRAVYMMPHAMNPYESLDNEREKLRREYFINALFEGVFKD